MSADPERLAELDERTHQLGRLARKHGEVGAADPIVDVLAFRDRARAELEALGSSEQQIELLERAHAAANQAAMRRAQALSVARRKAAEALGRAITTELGSLGMGGAEVRVDVADAGMSASGIDRCELLIAPNVGEDARALRKIASGGELSRVLLAIKRVLAGLREAEGRASGLYVFDEVDKGVGGAVVEVIGKKLRDVARHHQVLVITHLAPIAV